MVLGMKLTLGQNKILVAGLITLALAVFGWFAGRQVAIAPGYGNGQEKIAPPTITEAIVTKVIDGDTVVIQGGDHVRLLGIDADESGYPCYKAAKTRLEELVLGKTVKLEADQENLDQYGRLLRHVFLDGKNIDEQLVSEGLAIARFYPENQKYKTEIVAAETTAIQNKAGCKWGK